VPLDGRLEARVEELLARAADRANRTNAAPVPPDQLKPLLRQVGQGLLAQLSAARSQGGVDYYLPVDLMHGQLVSASMVVSTIVPDAAIEAELVPRVMASLLADEGSRAFTIDGLPWVRRERVRERGGDSFSESREVREVEYRSPVPAEPRRWVIVTATTLGDQGDVRGETADLVVELFDAMMSNWRWVGDGDGTTGA
jgi:hypothetical protein